MDRSRFIAAQLGDDILNELRLDQAVRHLRGQSFVLRLRIPLSDIGRDGEVIMPIDVDRLDPDYATNGSIIKHVNKDIFVKTTARLESDTRPFEIDMTFNAGLTHYEEPLVRVSPELEEIILEKLLELPPNNEA